MEKSIELQKETLKAFIDDTKAFGSVDHNKLWEILKELGVPEHLTCPLRNLYVGQKATFRTRPETAGWFKIGEERPQHCMLSPWLFNFCAEDVMWNAGLEEAQAGIKVSGREINDLRYVDGTILMAECEELKSLLMTVKEESEKAGLKLNIQKINK